MDYHQLFLELTTKFPKIEILENHPLAPHTTLKIGGPADIYVHTTTQDQYISILKFLHHLITGHRLLITDIHLFGNGSNVLISDSGLRGLVLQNSASGIKVMSNHPQTSSFQKTYTQRKENEPEKYLDFSKLDYDESRSPVEKVKVQAGTPLPLAINKTIDMGFTGLQWFAYIPGTVGGATWYNIHGGSYHLSDYIDTVKVFNLNTGKPEFFKKSDLSWKYEKSFFQQNPHLTILSTTFNLFLGDPDKAKQVVAAWIGQKIKVQPTNSAGSTFQNPPLEDCTRVWGEQKSAGWIIDHELGMKGRQIGGAQISPQHSNFIINTGNATATDYLALVKLVRDEVEKRFQIKLEMEVKMLGEFS